MSTRWALACLAVFLAAASATTGAADTAPSATMPQQAFEEFAQRLKLTPEQQSQIKPLFEARNAKLKNIYEKYGSDTSRAGKRAALLEAKSAQDDFNSKLTPLLTSDQQAQLDQMRQEARAKAKERWQERQKGGT